MTVQHVETLIGYSLFELGDECYLLNENAGFIAADIDAAERFLHGGWTLADECRIEPVPFAMIMRDYACTGGEYAMEREAFERFRKVAAGQQVTFTAEPYDGDDSLLIVVIDGTRSSDD